MIKVVHLQVVGMVQEDQKKVENMEKIVELEVEIL
jgi:hypothetical protein